MPIHELRVGSDVKDEVEEVFRSRANGGDRSFCEEDFLLEDSEGYGGMMAAARAMARKEEATQARSEGGHGRGGMEAR